jgi:hypothetical protein
LNPHLFEELEMETKHTPGPWQPGTENEGFFIANGELRPDIAKRITSAADASLIAAAPDLLAAAQSLLAMPDFDGTQATSQIRRSAKHLARAAIAKATGDQE